MIDCIWIFINLRCHWNRARTTDTQWRHKSKISEKLGQCGRQNMLWPYLGIGIKFSASLGVRSKWNSASFCVSSQIYSKQKILFWSLPFSTKNSCVKLTSILKTIPHHLTFSSYIFPHTIQGGSGKQKSNVPSHAMRF